MNYGFFSLADLQLTGNFSVYFILSFIFHRSFHSKADLISKVLFDFITARSINQEFFLSPPRKFRRDANPYFDLLNSGILVQKTFSTWSNFFFWTILIKLLGPYNISWSVQLSSTINMWQFKNSVQCLEIKKSSKNFCKVCIN